MDLFEVINPIPMFKNLNEDEKREIAGMEHDLLKYAKGDTIIEEGEDSQSLFLLLKGSALITKQSGEANIRLSKIRSGEVFGEMSFFSRKPRQSNAVANEDVMVMRMDEGFFEKISPPIRDKVKNYFIEILIGRLDVMNDSIMKISQLVHS